MEASRPDAKNAFEYLERGSVRNSRGPVQPRTQLRTVLELHARCRYLHRNPIVSSVDPQDSTAGLLEVRIKCDGLGHGI